MQANFKSDMRSIFNTDERTYERDEDATSRRDESTGCNARARTTDGPALIGELLVPGDLWPTERHPVIRSGERDEILVGVAVEAPPGRGAAGALGGVDAVAAFEGWPWRYVDGAPECQVHHVGVSHHNPWRCPVVRGYKSAFARAGVLPTWHRIEPLNSGSTVAYCAHCNAPGLTSVTL